MVLIQVCHYMVLTIEFNTLRSAIHQCEDIDHVASTNGLTCLCGFSIDFDIPTLAGFGGQTPGFKASRSQSH